MNMREKKSLKNSNIPKLYLEIELVCVYLAQAGKYAYFPKSAAVQVFM